MIGIFALMSVGATAQLELGGALVFGTEISTIGLQARGQYEITEEFDGTANLTYFFPKTEGVSGFEVKLSMFTINFDGHYNAYSSGTVEVYPLLGLNISIVTIKTDFDIPGTTTSAKLSDTNVGLNVGGGAAFEISDGLNAFGELKYVASSFDQLVISAGIMKTL